MPIIIRAGILLLRYFGRTLLIGVPAFLAYEFLLFKKVYAEKLRGYRLDALRHGSPAGDPAGSSAKALASTAGFFLDQAGHALKLSVTHPSKIGSDFTQAVDKQIAKGINYNPIDNVYIQSSIAREFGGNPQTTAQKPRHYAQLKTGQSETARNYKPADSEPALENMPGVEPERRRPIFSRPAIVLRP